MHIFKVVSLQDLDGGGEDAYFRNLLRDFLFTLQLLRGFLSP